LYLKTNLFNTKVLVAVQFVKYCQLVAITVVVTTKNSFLTLSVPRT